MLCKHEAPFRIDEVTNGQCECVTPRLLVGAALTESNSVVVRDKDYMASCVRALHFSLFVVL